MQRRQNEFVRSDGVARMSIFELDVLAGVIGDFERIGDTRDIERILLAKQSLICTVVVVSPFFHLADNRLKGETEFS